MKIISEIFLGKNLTFLVQHLEFLAYYISKIGIVKVVLQTRMPTGSRQVKLMKGVGWVFETTGIGEDSGKMESYFQYLRSDNYPTSKD